MALIFDDCGFDRQKMNSKTIKRLFQNGRHYGLCVCIALQYCLSLGPALRSNCDFVFCSREKSPIFRKKLYEVFNLCFKNHKEFDAVYQACTTNYDIFVLANALPTSSDRVEDNIFFWKAQFPIPEFKINRSGKWWRLSSIQHDSARGELKNTITKVGRVSSMQIKEKEIVERKRYVTKLPTIRKRGKKFK